MGLFSGIAGKLFGAGAGSFLGPIGGQLAGAAVSGLLTKKGSKGSKSSQAAVRNAAPFTPSNIYTPSGSTTWNKGVGTAALSPEIAGLRSNYVGNANKYQSAIDEYFAPNKNNFYSGQTTAGTSAFTPMSYDEWAKTQGGAMSGNSASSSTSQPTARDGHMSMGGYVVDTWNPPTQSANTSNQSNTSALQTGYQNYLSANPARQGTAGSQGTFDQAGYDKAVAGYKDPATVYYNKLRALSQPSENEARAENESRLFSQGLLGQSNGQGYNPGIKSFEDSAHQADQQREIQSINYAPDMIAKYQNLQNSAVGGVQSFDKNPLDMLQLGANIGLGAGTNSIANANSQNAIQSSKGNFWGAAAGNIGKSVSNGVTQIFDKYSSPFSSSIPSSDIKKYSSVGLFGGY